MPQPRPFQARGTLFEGDLLRIGHVVRGGPPECGAEERQDASILVFPLRGVFAKHMDRRRYVLGTPNHAVLIAAGEPYRVSLPGGIGEECMTLWFSPEQLDAEALQPHGLLPAQALLARSILWRLLQDRLHDALQVEETSLQLVSAATAGNLRPANRVQVERVKEAIAVEPHRRWTLSALARRAGASRYHLARMFREEVGTTVHSYVTRARLALALPRVLDAEDLTTVALDCGFASHSHFTARFRAFFGMTPSELRKNVTAPIPAAA
jgi:AraC family transcriptional regulator